MTARRWAASSALVAAFALAGGAACAQDLATGAAPAAVHYRVIDAEGTTIGELTIDRGGGRRLRIAEFARRAVPAPPPDQRTFAPNYANALSAEQMSAAWARELARIFPQPPTGGG